MRPSDSTQAYLRLSVRSADARIEMEAEAILRRCMTTLGIRSVPLPVPVETWIEKPLGYKLEFRTDLGDGVLGSASPEALRIRLSESLLASEARLRFTCAHELGHLLLHSASREMFRDVELPAITQADRLEREADRFAAALLMPITTLPAEIERVRTGRGLDPTALRLLRGQDLLSIWLWRRCLIPSLSDRYGVSRAAMVYRCRELRLPGQRRLLRPSLVPLLIVPDHALSALDLDSVELENGLPVMR